MDKRIKNDSGEFLDRELMRLAGKGYIAAGYSYDEDGGVELSLAHKAWSVGSGMSNLKRALGDLSPEVKKSLSSIRTMTLAEYQGDRDSKARHEVFFCDTKNSSRSLRQIISSLRKLFSP